MHPGTDTRSDPASSRRLLIEARIRMLIPVRTTLVIDDRLLQRAKIAAAREGSTVSELVERALRDALREDATGAETPFVFPTYGKPAGGRAKKSPSPAELKAALSDQDDDAFRGRRR